MKKLLSLAVVTFAFAAMAEYTGQTIGVTKITTTNINTIVAVPFTSLTNGLANISANDLVSTNGLPADTVLQVFKNDQYYGWQLDRNAGWVAVGDSSTSAAAVIANSTIACGGAIWVVLPSAPATSQDIYIYGDFSNEPKESAIVAGANLIANPLQSDATFTLSGTPAKGDQIIIPNDSNPESYTYSKKGKWTGDGAAVNIGSLSIKVGQGFWYVRKDGSEVSKVTWN